MPRRARYASLAVLPAAVVISDPARAQTVAQSGQLFPDRIVNGVDLGPSTRPQNLTPLGVNYSDCIEDMVLRFNVLVSGFNGAQSMQVWATKSGDCTQPTSRGVGGNAVITCWLVNQGFTGDIINTNTTRSFDIRVQDLVGPQNLTGLTNGVPTPQGPSACSAQATFVAVPINIYFLPLDSGTLNTVGTPYMYSLATDLVGPPAPGGVTAQVGDTLLQVTWAPNADADTTGYDVFLDPIPGQEDASAISVEASLVCPDASASVPAPNATPDGSDDGAISDAASDGSNDSSASNATASNTFTGCTNAFAPPSGNNCKNSCTSSVLTAGMVQDGGPVVETDEAGNPLEGGVISGNGGLSNIPASYVVNASSSTGVTVPDKNTGTYTITGLINGPPGYSAAVAAVDGFGNVGPPSALACGCPALVNDFWSLYRMDGGKAGGGCALEAAGKPGPALTGMALMTAASVLARRRKRSRRGRRLP